MTAEQKAKELVDEFIEFADSNYMANEFDKNWHGNFLAGERKVRKESAKQCVLICIDKLIEQNGELYLNGLDGDYYRAKNAELFDIKQEIEKL